MKTETQLKSRKTHLCGSISGEPVEFVNISKLRLKPEKSTA
ncbi:hypothetical protein MC7420_1379 [Coleofasciculus chthonoplastes PCC 7420]|uniref:Uncharacterized protein n=1 Tax=Coleofasciculus chthonoplastes PCC 7420 TaxID=118168 RepID=B4VRE9_9CYAN|nr:hypothetical protein MC7420_1379 [Coleofasciculus chthonoplastes PCC 7420]